MRLRKLLGGWLLGGWLVLGLGLDPAWAEPTPRAAQPEQALEQPEQPEQSDQPIPAPHQLDGTLYFRENSITSPHGFGWIQVPVGWGDYYMALDLRSPIDPPFTIDLQTYDYTPDGLFGVGVLRRWVEAFYSSSQISFEPLEGDLGRFEEGSLSFQTSDGIRGAAAVALTPDLTVVMLLGRGKAFSEAAYLAVAQSLQAGVELPAALQDEQPRLVAEGLKEASMSRGTMPVPEGFVLNRLDGTEQTDAAFFLRGSPLAAVVVIAGQGVESSNLELAEAQSQVYLSDFAQQAGLDLSLESVEERPDLGPGTYLSHLSGQALSAEGGQLYIVFQPDYTLTLLLVGQVEDVDPMELLKSYRPTP